MSKGRNVCPIVLVAVSLLLSGCGAGKTPAPAPTPIALTIPGLVLYYPFNGNANDLSSSGTNGQVHGATLAKDRFGKADRAYHFDGVDDSVTFDASRMPIGNAPRTISAWVNVEGFPPEILQGLGSRATVVGWGLGDWEKLSEMLVWDGRVQYHTYDSFSRDVTSNTTLELNRWYHLVVVYADGSESVYINGIEDKHGPCALDTAAGKGTIGDYPDPQLTFAGSIFHSYFHGTIDDVSVYNQALSPAQIQALYTEGGWGK